MTDQPGSAPDDAATAAPAPPVTTPGTLTAGARRQPPPARFPPGRRPPRRPGAARPDPGPPDVPRHTVGGPPRVRARDDVPEVPLLRPPAGGRGHRHRHRGALVRCVG